MNYWRLLIVLSFVFAGSWWSCEALAANTRSSKAIEFDRDLEVRAMIEPKSAMPLGIESLRVYLQPSVRTLEKRLEATTRQKPYGESLKLKMSRVRLESEVSRLALPKVRALLSQTGSQDQAAIGFLEGLTRRVEDEDDVLSLDGRDLRWLDLQRLSDRIRISSLMPVLTYPEWERALGQLDTRAKLEEFFGSHWGRVERVLEKTSAQRQGFSDEDWPKNDHARQVQFLSLLPEHMQELYGRYSSFRGRNCFATALLFGDPDSVTSKRVNFIREPDHHFAMVNSDEFSEALWRGYRELTPEEEDEGLRFGDIVVLRDAAEGEGYRSLLHAAVHMGGEYYFHKPSKSASSPIEFTNWKDLVSPWRRLAKMLTYRVYRKKPINSDQYTNPTALDLKIDWTP